MVYANYGDEADFVKLEELGVNIKGKILLMRYAHSSRGTKVINSCLAFEIKPKMLTLRWPRRGGGGEGGCLPPNKFFQFFSEMGMQTKFLPVGSSLGHLSMKKFFRSDLPF